MGVKLARELAVASSLDCSSEKRLLQKLSALSERIETGAEALASTMASLAAMEELPRLADGIRDRLLPEMAALRAAADEAEGLTAKAFWPFPGYGELLFG